MRDFQFNIYNRWGELVFSADDSSQKWDGTFKGINAPVGTYYYMVHYTPANGKIVNGKGDITLIR